MIQVSDRIWVGDSADECGTDLDDNGITAVLNVAHDLQATRGVRTGVEYMQVGLVDGPGNPLAAYAAAVLALSALVKRHESVLVCCHSGGRAMAVVIMCMNAVVQRGWDNCVDILEERLEIGLPKPHAAHRTAFNKINWKLLKVDQ